MDRKIQIQDIIAIKQLVQCHKLLTKLDHNLAKVGVDSLQILQDWLNKYHLHHQEENSDL